VDSASRYRGPTKVSRSRTALWRSGEFGAVVLGPAGDDVVTLEGTGAALWDLLVSPCSADEVVEALVLEFGAAERARIERDVPPFLARLEQLGVIEVQP
jgi:hypothetical protein